MADVLTQEQFAQGEKLADEILEHLRDKNKGASLVAICAVLAVVMVGMDAAAPDPAFGIVRHFFAQYDAANRRE